MAARLAAKKMSEVQLKALGDQVVELRRCSLFAESDPTALVNATYDFHQQIIAAAGNAFISRFLGTLAPFDRTVLRIATIVPKEAPQDALEHQAICDAIQSRHGAAAERLMHHHIERVIDDLFGSQ
jgi:DNA-binding GntR family transcriptional regulator